MKTINVTAFKAHALEIVSRVAKFHENIIITKRGQAVVEIKPYKSHKSISESGKLAASLVEEKDIVSPFGDSLWDAGK